MPLSLTTPLYSLLLLLPSPSLYISLRCPPLLLIPSPFYIWLLTFSIRRRICTARCVFQFFYIIQWEGRPLGRLPHRSCHFHLLHVASVVCYMDYAVTSGASPICRAAVVHSLPRELPGLSFSMSFFSPFLLLSFLPSLFYLSPYSPLLAPSFDQGSPR